MMTDPHTIPPELLEGDLVKAEDPRFGLIWINPNRMHGEPCFFRTRVPVRSLWDYLEGGDTIDEFIEQFPPITREQVVQVMELASEHLLQSPGAA
ncbi:MAG: DUF433 domain-containing protein [Phycisphaeraceae bacterium]